MHGDSNRLTFDEFLEQRRNWLGIPTWKEVARRARLTEGTIQSIREQGPKTQASESSLHLLALVLEADSWQWLLEAYEEQKPYKSPPRSIEQLERLATQLAAVLTATDQAKLLIDKLDPRATSILAKLAIDRLAGAPPVPSNARTVPRKPGRVRPQEPPR